MDWVKFNVDMSGYYMVHYEGAGWNAIISLLHHNHTVLTANDRASLVHDVFQLVRSVGTKRQNVPGTRNSRRSVLHSCVLLQRGEGEAGHGSGTVPVPVQGDGDHGRDPGLPGARTSVQADGEAGDGCPGGPDEGWNTVDQTAVALLLPTHSVRVFQSYIVHLFRDLIDRQEWSDSGSVSERVLRSYLLLFGSVRNYPPCVEKATQLFNAWRASGGQMRSEVAHPPTPLEC